MVITDPRKGTAELGQQIAKLMATLTQAGQSNGTSSVPSSPWERCHRWGTIVVAPPVAQTPTIGRGDPDQMTQACSLPTRCEAGSTKNGAMTRITKGLQQGGMAQPIFRTQTLSNASGSWGDATWPGNALPQHQL